MNKIKKAKHPFLQEESAERKFGARALGRFVLLGVLLSGGLHVFAATGGNRPDAGDSQFDPVWKTCSDTLTMGSGDKARTCDVQVKFWPSSKKNKDCLGEATFCAETTVSCTNPKEHCVGKKTCGLCGNGVTPTGVNCAGHTFTGTPAFGWAAAWWDCTGMTIR